MATRIDQQLHDEMIRHLVSRLTYNDYTNIRADIDGMNRPEPIRTTGLSVPESTPDAYATKDGGIYLFEVETEDTIATGETEDQWRLFSAHAEKIKAHFIPIVPTGMIPEAQQRCEKLGILVEDIWDICMDQIQAAEEHTMLEVDEG